MVAFPCITVMHAFTCAVPCIVATNMNEYVTCAVPFIENSLVDATNMNEYVTCAVLCIEDYFV
jgi:hypothetical protein